MTEDELKSVLSVNMKEYRKKEGGSFVESKKIPTFAAEIFPQRVNK